MADAASTPAAAGAAGAPEVQIVVKFFASGRELTDTDEVTLALPAAGANSTAVLQELQKRFDQLTDEWLSTIVLALNEEYIEPGVVVELKSGDELALIPPISGG